MRQTARLLKHLLWISVGLFAALWHGYANEAARFQGSGRLLSNTYLTTDSLEQSAPPENRDDLSQKDTTRSKVSIITLPIVIYSEVFKWGAGAFVGIQGLSQENMSLNMGGLISTNGTRYGFLQFREFYLPFFPRLYFEPDILGGYFGVLKMYKDLPGTSPDAEGKPRAGSNESDTDDYLEVSGYDQWYETNIRYLLPIGHGREKARFHPVLKDGILVSGETGGTNWSPLKSGRTFFDVMPFYRKRISFSTAGLELALTHENMDYYNNPTRGSYRQIALRRDWGGLGSSAPWTVIETDWRWYLPLNEILFGYSKDDPYKPLPRVLALNFWTIQTLTWDAWHVEGTNPDGSENKVYHRPPPYTGAYLGGRYRMRAFYEGRFNDRAAIYYGAEYRQIIKWNPFNATALTRKLKVHWVQLAAFAELGRVAPEWKLSTLHKDMKWSAGGGFRVFMNNLVLRVDGGVSREGFLTQMYVDHAF